MMVCIYTNLQKKKKVASNAIEIVETLVRNSLSLLTVCVFELFKKKKKTQSNYPLSKDQNHVDVPEEQGIIHVLDDKSKP